MAIQVGQRLGPYEILSAIGAGGMGEVYRAKDTRLDRIIAIKVLPSHLADRAELRERFEREARTIASLDHPHICTLHDIGHQDGTDYLVMEYLEGETLAERLKKGPLPLNQVLQFAIEIADALDKAHRKGITHRDLKPGNIMLTKSGAKLLDFGLAKLKQESAAPVSELPTKDAITAEGSIVGTLQYMAPEQIEGKQSDTRTDIFAFGAVVYEMATGKKAFEGKTSASVMAKILESDPAPMTLLQPMTPPALDRVVKKCLVKEPEDRWQSAKDLTDELKWIAEESAPRSAPSGVPVAPSHVSPRWMVVFAVAGLVVAAIAAFAVWFLRPTPQRPVTRFAISLPAGQRVAALDSPFVVLSPDGTRLAYVATQGSIQQLYLRAMDSPEAKPIPGTEGATAPFFSPDSQWVGFFVGTKLKKISVSGGAAVTLCDVAPVNFQGASWGSGDTIVFQAPGGPLRVSAAGGTPQRFATVDSKKAEDYFWPEFLPGGNAVLFAAGAGIGSLADAGHVVVLSQQSGKRRDLTGGTRPSYAPTGHLIYAQAGTLMAMPFDAQRLTVTGSPVPVLEGVLESTASGVGQYSFSSTGSLVYLSGGPQGTQRRLVWVDRKGAEQPLPAPARGYRTPRLSPDGRRVAVGTTESQIWLYDLARETLTRLTFQGSGNTPIWTPDGKRVAFQSSVAGDPAANVFWQLADGSGSAERLTAGEYQHIDGSWSPDGQVLAFVEVNPTTGRDIWTLHVSGDRKPQPFLRTPFNEAAPQFSPDGRWLAYASDESGRYEIYVRPYPGPGGKWQISTEGGNEPVWGHNGEIFYRSGNKMVAVDTTSHPSFSAGRPKVLFESPYVPALQTNANYDVSPDGQRFLMVKENEATSAAQINVVLNWFEELKQKVPTGKK
jgi:eukaryotic-like serine/threonine-protein kinase